MTRRISSLATVAALVVTCLSATASSAATPRCFGRRATIVGTNRDPLEPVKLNGTKGNDVIVGLKGWDIIRAGAGNDLICGGGGDDYIKAQGGDDKVTGQGNMDTLYGGPGDDYLWGGDNSDTLSGGFGHDRIFGGVLGDSLMGGPGDDILVGGADYDMAEFWDSPRGVEVDLGTDIATGQGQDLIKEIEGLVGSKFDDLLYGDEHSNVLVGEEGDDELYALGSSLDGGADLLRSSGGEDLLDGGDGPDTVSYNLAPIPVEANLVTGEATSAFGFGHDTFVDIENLTGSKEDDVLIGDDGNNVILGNWGSDVLDGGGGRDEASFVGSRYPVSADLAAGAATSKSFSDTLTGFEDLAGSSWDDVLKGDDGPNLLWGGPGADLLEGHAGDDELLGAHGQDEADGGDDTDTCKAEVTINCEGPFLPSGASGGPRDALDIFRGLWGFQL